MDLRVKYSSAVQRRYLGNECRRQGWKSSARSGHARVAVHVHPLKQGKSHAGPQPTIPRFPQGYYDCMLCFPGMQQPIGSATHIHSGKPGGTGGSYILTSRMAQTLHCPLVNPAWSAVACAGLTNPPKRHPRICLRTSRNGDPAGSPGTWCPW